MVSRVCIVGSLLALGGCGPNVDDPSDAAPCDGTAMFVDEVLDYAPAMVGGAWPQDERFIDPQAAIGEPDYTGDPMRLGAVSLGRGGWIDVALIDCSIGVDGTSSPDLVVYEVGPILERVFVEVHPTAATLERLRPGSRGIVSIAVGAAERDAPAIDLDAAFEGHPPEALRFDAIRLIDDPDQGADSPETPGADIDAIEILSPTD